MKDHARWIGLALVALGLALGAPRPTAAHGASSWVDTPVVLNPLVANDPPPPQNPWQMLSNFVVDKVGKWFMQSIFGTVGGMFGTLGDIFGVSAQRISGANNDAVLTFSCSPTFGGVNRNLIFCTPPDLLFGDAGFGPTLKEIWGKLTPLVAMLILTIGTYRVATLALATPRPPLGPELARIGVTLLLVIVLHKSLAWLCEQLLRLFNELHTTILGSLTDVNAFVGLLAPRLPELFMFDLGANLTRLVLLITVFVLVIKGLIRLLKFGLLLVPLPVMPVLLLSPSTAPAFRTWVGKLLDLLFEQTSWVFFIAVGMQFLMPIATRSATETTSIGQIVPNVIGALVIGMALGGQHIMHGIIGGSTVRMGSGLVGTLAAVSVLQPAKRWASAQWSAVTGRARTAAGASRATTRARGAASASATAAEVRASANETVRNGSQSVLRKINRLPAPLMAYTPTDLTKLNRVSEVTARTSTIADQSSPAKRQAMQVERVQAVHTRRTINAAALRRAAHTARADGDHELAAQYDGLAATEQRRAARLQTAARKGHLPAPRQSRWRTDDAAADQAIRDRNQEQLRMRRVRQALAIEDATHNLRDHHGTLQAQHDTLATHQHDLAYALAGGVAPDIVAMLEDRVRVSTDLIARSKEEIARKTTQIATQRMALPATMEPIAAHERVAAMTPEAQRAWRTAELYRALRAAPVPRSDDDAATRQQKIVARAALLRDLAQEHLAVLRDEQAALGPDAPDATDRAHAIAHQAAQVLAYSQAAAGTLAPKPGRADAAARRTLFAQVNAVETRAAQQRKQQATAMHNAATTAREQAEATLVAARTARMAPDLTDAGAQALDATIAATTAQRDAAIAQLAAAADLAATTTTEAVRVRTAAVVQDLARTPPAPNAPRDLPSGTPPPAPRRIPRRSVVAPPGRTTGTADQASAPVLANTDAYPRRVGRRVSAQGWRAYNENRTAVSRQLTALTTNLAMRRTVDEAALRAQILAAGSDVPRLLTLDAALRTQQARWAAQAAAIAAVRADRRLPLPTPLTADSEVTS